MIVNAGGMKGADFGAGGMPLAWYKGLKAKGFSFVVLDTYSKTIASDVGNALEAGLGLCFFQGYYAQAWAQPSDSVLRAHEALDTLKSLEGNVGQSLIYLDCEASGSVSSENLNQWVSAWGNEVAQGGFAPGIYQGSGFGLSAKELYDLPMYDHYWKSAADVQYIPVRGYSMVQTQVNVVIDGYTVDIDMTAPDNEAGEVFLVNNAIAPVKPAVANTQASVTKYALVAVKPGTTVWGLAAQFHTSVEAINEENGLSTKTDRLLQLGRVLKIPYQS